MTNRMRLLRAANDLGKVMEESSPTPYMSLQKARDAICAASMFPLDIDERDHVRNGLTLVGFSTGRPSHTDQEEN